jgi:hypothetical protein
MRGRHYPAYSPRVLAHRLSHYLVGPLLGCSCSGPGIDENGGPLGRRSLLARKSRGCFYSKWRIEYPARDGYRDRVRLAQLEKAVGDAGIKVPR